MHIPDGFFNDGGRTAIATTVLAAAGVGVAVREANRHLPRRRIPLMGLAASVIFAAQMLNFPILPGVSGHLVGSVLAAVLLGPAAGVVVMTAVLIVECFVFMDGGVSALGANIFNMALVGCVGGYAVYRAVRLFFPGPRGRLLGAAFAAWCSTVAAAVCCAGELAFSGVAPASSLFPAMVGYHMLIGLGEAVITALTLSAISRTRPELLDVEGLPRSPSRFIGVTAFGLLIALGLAVFVAPFACEWPDGLEATVSRLGLMHKAAAPLISVPMPEYRVPGISSPLWATALAGAIGTVIAFLLAMLLAWFLGRERRPQPVTDPAA